MVLGVVLWILLGVDPGLFPAVDQNLAVHFLVKKKKNIEGFFIHRN